ncbi:MAG: DUF951 domain-containing protein [Saccharofermentanales bacterium]
MAGKFDLYPFKIGEILTLKKTHPCGSCEWKVERVGQEIGIRCMKCAHFLLIARRPLEKAVKRINSCEKPDEKSKSGEKPD